SLNLKGSRRSSTRSASPIRHFPSADLLSGRTWGRLAVLVLCSKNFAGWMDDLANAAFHCGNALDTELGLGDDGHRRFRALGWARRAVSFPRRCLRSMGAPLIEPHWVR